MEVWVGCTVGACVGCVVGVCAGRTVEICVGFMVAAWLALVDAGIVTAGFVSVGFVETGLVSEGFVSDRFTSDTVPVACVVTGSDFAGSVLDSTGSVGRLSMEMLCVLEAPPAIDSICVACDCVLSLVSGAAVVEVSGSTGAQAMNTAEAKRKIIRIRASDLLFIELLPFNKL